MASFIFTNQNEKQNKKMANKVGSNQTLQEVYK